MFFVSINFSVASKTKHNPEGKRHMRQIEEDECEIAFGSYDILRFRT